MPSEARLAKSKLREARRCAAAAQFRRRHLAAVQQHQVELGAEAANRDPRAFTKAPVDRHAGDALQRLGKVGIGELADVDGGNGIDDADGVALGVHRLAKAGADAGDDDVFRRSRVFDSGAPARGQD
jgi:hypothetical protein